MALSNEAGGAVGFKPAFVPLITPSCYVQHARREVKCQGPEILFNPCIMSLPVFRSYRDDEICHPLTDPLSEPAGNFADPVKATGQHCY